MGAGVGAGGGAHGKGGAGVGAGVNAGVGAGIGADGKAPSSSWKCNGSGKDGVSVDIHGKGRPSWCPEGWLYFGA